MDKDVICTKTTAEGQKKWNYIGANFFVYYFNKTGINANQIVISQTIKQ